MIPILPMRPIFSIKSQQKKFSYRAALRDTPFDITTLICVICVICGS